MKRLALIAPLLMLLGILIPATTTRASVLPMRPMIFVHGFEGSGGQFESQAMRFETNGYPHNFIKVLEYDSSSLMNLTTREVNQALMEQIWADLDKLIADTEQETGASEVDILGHSLGTLVMQGYINSSAERAEKIAHYVNIDGGTATALPGTAVGRPVPTLALWAGTGTPGRSITGALNVVIPNQTHVQCATSPESFFQMYEFFRGTRPSTTSITPEDPVKLAGRAVLFPQNVGLQNATLEIWEVDGNTGERLHQKPEAVYNISGDGSFGPFTASNQRHYEFALLRPDEFVHHFYFEPFPRSDYLIRLETEEPDAGIGVYTDKNDHQTDLIVIRYKELWGDQPGQNDALTVDGTNVVNAATCPIDKRVIALFIYDKGADGISDVSTPIAFYAAIPFLTGVDLFIPAANPPDKTVSVVLTPRDANGKTQKLNVPNWPSLTDRVTLQFHDYYP